MKISDLQTVHNFAKNNGVTTTTVYNWIKAGKLQCVTIDGTKFIYQPKT